jgi:aryl-alcohol dehydrogenase-like predicted oxidoreductase
MGRIRLGDIGPHVTRVCLGLTSYGERPQRVRQARDGGDRRLARAQVALAWLLHNPGVTAPIVGATKIGHLEDALAAADLGLSDDEIARLEEPCVPHAVLGRG